MISKQFELHVSFSLFGDMILYDDFVCTEMNEWRMCDGNIRKKEMGIFIYININLFIASLVINYIYSFAKYFG